MNAAENLDISDADTTVVQVDLAAVKRQIALRYVQKLRVIAKELYDCELYREASDLLRYLTLVEPSNPTNWYWLGRSLFFLGDPLQAAHVFELGGRISHVRQFRRLAADAWQRAGYFDRARALMELEEAEG